MYMHTIVLIEPKIPQNTGTIARLCAATNSKLLLVGELGFSLDDKYLKRAGLDYWNYVLWEHEPDLEYFLEKEKIAVLIYCRVRQRNHIPMYPTLPINPCGLAVKPKVYQSGLKTNIKINLLPFQWPIKIFEV